MPAVSDQESLAALCDLAVSKLGAAAGPQRLARPHEGLLILSHQAPSDHLAQVYDPVVCLVLQGAKETSTTERTHPIEAGQFLVVTHDMPVVSRITKACPDKPYVALIASLDDEILKDLRQHVPPASEAGDDRDPYALRVGTVDSGLINAFGRYLGALGSVSDAEVIAPLTVREIHYRLLMSAHGETLRRLAEGKRPAEPIARAIAVIRQDLAAPLSIPNLAREVGLSPSALHHHFKAVTGTTPVQYQKQLRLLEARHIIQSDSQSVTDAAYAVGYGSATQFSREYRRAFGHPPSHERLVAQAS